MHYALIKNQIEKDFDDVVVLGYIGKNLDSLSSTHLGLDLKEAKEEVLEKLSSEVLEHIDMEKLDSLSVSTSLSFLAKTAY